MWSRAWRSIDWSIIQQKVGKAQTKIYNSHNNCRDLQENLLNSPEAKLLRRVAVTSSGRNTSGVDNVKSLTALERIYLASTLCLNGKADFIRRHWIPKPGTNEKRPLGIPTIRDRAKKALVKIAIEPQWEAKFEPHSFGFRPGIKAHDATWNKYFTKISKIYPGWGYLKML